MLLEVAEHARMAAGFSMLATIRTTPPHWAQTLTSIATKIAWSDLEQPKAGPKGGGQDAPRCTRLSRSAKVIARRRSAGLRSSGLDPLDPASVADRLPRPDGVNCARRLEFGANMLRWPFQGVSDVAVVWCSAGILALCALWLSAVEFSFRTGWRLRS